MMYIAIGSRQFFATLALRCLCLALFGAVALVGTGQAKGDVISLDDVDARRIKDNNKDGVGDAVESNQLWVGNISLADWAVVMVFKMTGLTSGSQIADAGFSVTRDNVYGTTPDIAVDAFIRSTSGIVASDYENSSATSLMSGSFGDGTTDPRMLSATGEANLTSFLQSNWAENEFVYIRLRSATVPTTISNQAYRFGNSDGGWRASSTDAQLTLTTAVPEPTSVLMLAGALASFAFRRRKQVQVETCHENAA